jgi:prophage regulatory protein
LRPQINTTATTMESIMKLLRERDLVAKGLSYSSHTLKKLEAAGEFPRRVKLSERKSAWPENEIDDFVAKRIAERDA